jgi:NitT/TauT family transport system ATP-binding protein
MAGDREQPVETQGDRPATARAAEVANAAPGPAELGRTEAWRHATTPERRQAGAPGSAWRALRVASVWKRFADVDGAPWILRDVTLTFERSSFTCIVGPSGSGKTTLLNLVAGFEAPTSGLVALDDAPIAGAGRDRAVIFQDVANALFPWLTARENVEFGLRIQGLSRHACRERATAQLATVGLDGHGDKFPYQLSGGMKQRVQIARALANEPEVLLMDEPFGALDAITRRDLQDELARLWAATRKTIVFITHDLIEALLLATRVVVLGAHGVVRGEFPVSLTAPRSPSHPDFMRLYEELQAILTAEVQRTKRGADGEGPADHRNPGDR